MFSLIRKKYILLILLLFTICFSQTYSDQINTNKNKIKINSISQNYNIKKEKKLYFRHLATDTCAITSYSKSDIQEECNDGPSSYDRILRYKSLVGYISNHNYHSNGLNYVTSLLVDSETHHFGNFMNDGVGMIILYIIDGLLLIGWIPLLYCWKKRCCLFGECLYEDDCCIIFWHILTYFLAAAILSFIIVVLCFGA